MKKTFYIFLCMLLGVALLLIIQHALVAIYLIVSDNYLTYNLLSASQLQMANWGTAILLVILGLLYGNYLGHHWYPLVYGEGSGDKKSSTTSASTRDEEGPLQKTVTVKPVRAAKNKVSLKSETKGQVWDFDDLLNHDMPAVESLSGAAPAIASAVSLGEPAKGKPASPAKKVVVRKPKRPAAKTAAKSAAKVKVKS